MRHVGYALAALALAALPASAEGPQRAAGVWEGVYTCSQGETGVTLRVRERGQGVAEAIFHFYPIADNPDLAEGCYRMAGAFEASSGALQLSAGDWIVHPDGWVTTDMVAVVSGDALHGRILTPFPSACAAIDARRVTRTARPPPPGCAGSGPVADLSAGGSPDRAGRSL